MRGHPFIPLLRQRTSRRLWYGLGCSAAGNQLYAIGIAWLAIGVAGAQASLLVACEYGALLAASLVSGILVDRFRPKSIMVATDLARAALSFVPVLAYASDDLSLPLLVGTAMALMALEAAFAPVLLACVPRLSQDAGEIQAFNGLLDATNRLARLVGPFLAGLLGLLIPAVHFLSLNAFSFVISAAAIARAGPALDAIPPAQPEQVGVRQRLTQGFHAAWRDCVIRPLLLANTIVLAAWALGVTIGIAMLVAARPPAGFAGLGLTSLGLILGAYGIGDLLSNVIVAVRTSNRRIMFAGYIVLGTGLAAVAGISGLGLDTAGYGILELPAMMVAAMVAGAGGPIFFLPMMTFLQTRLYGADLTAVLRLRLAMIAAAMAGGTAIGPVLFARFGPVAVVAGCGAVIAGVGIYGCVRRLARRGDSI